MYHSLAPLSPESHSRPCGPYRSPRVPCQQCRRNTLIALGGRDTAVSAATKCNGEGVAAADGRSSIHRFVHGATICFHPYHDISYELKAYPVDAELAAIGQAVCQRHHRHSGHVVDIVAYLSRAIRCRVCRDSPTRHVHTGSQLGIGEASVDSSIIHMQYDSHDAPVVLFGFWDSDHDQNRDPAGSQCHRFVGIFGVCRPIEVKAPTQYQTSETQKQCCTTQCLKHIAAALPCPKMSCLSCVRTRRPHIQNSPEASPRSLRRLHGGCPYSPLDLGPE